jgi:5'-3' exonuclease
MNTMLVDFNQIVITGVTQNLKRAEAHKKFEKGSDLTPKERSDLILHICLNTLRHNIARFKSDYPNIVLCFDAKQYWRKEFFPLYKSHRKADREASEFDWPLIFDTINVLKADLKKNFPYKIMDVEKAEADDIIAVLTTQLHYTGEVLILSADKDFTQLQKYTGVKQFSPMQDHYVKVDYPIDFIREHVIRGDRGDGIPNILSDDDCFVMGVRQKSISKKMASDWIRDYAFNPFGSDQNLYKRFIRNKTLIDFDYIPEEIKESIRKEYDGLQEPQKGKVLNYLIEKRLNNLIESVGDF